MTTARAIVLGILQGLGEFLPISSSGHLIVVPWLMGWPDSGLAFDVALHLGTLAAVAFAFWRDWVRLIGAGLRGIAAGKPFADPDARLLWYVALATIPGAVVGKLLDEWAETVFRSPALVSLTMALMGLVLWLADRRAQPVERRDRVAAGRARSSGWPRPARSSPAPRGPGPRSAWRSSSASGGRARPASASSWRCPSRPGPPSSRCLRSCARAEDHGPVLAGMLAAALSGFVAIRFLLSYVRVRDYKPFVYYRFAFAILVWGLLLVRRAHLG